MISSQEFQRMLQSGKIDAALALLVRDAIEIDVTTRLNENSITSQTSSEYLRTKINLLTGEIQNEVGKDVVTEGNSYLKLQQLHIEQIVASDRIIQGYLNQLKTILGVLATNASAPERSTEQSLAARLAQAALLLKKYPVSPSSVSNSIQLQQSPSGSTSPTPLSPIPVPIDDDLDLSIDAEGEVWEEWVEDEDFSTESLSPQPSPSLPSMLTIADRSDNLVRRHLNSLAVKPTPPRTAPESSNSSPQWDKFAPDYIDTDPQPPVAKNKLSNI